MLPTRLPPIRSLFVNMRNLVIATRGALASLSVTAFVAACGAGEKKESSSSAASSGAAASGLAPVVNTVKPPEKPTIGFSTPESVRYDADLDVFFVSNINGVPSEKDGNGFISKIDPSHPDSATRFLESGKNGVVLNAPKGMVVVGDTLWVTDIDALRAFNKRTGAVVATIDFAPLGATFMNDVAAAPDGALYITDTGIHIDAKGNTTHPGKDRIYVVHGREASIAMEDEHLASPNGIAWDAANRRFLLAPFGSKNVQAWRIGDARVTQITPGKGSYDGIEALPDGSFLITSWADSTLNLTGTGQGMRKIAWGIDAPADIGVDFRRGWIAVPRFNANRVDWYAVPF